MALWEGAAFPCPGINSGFENDVMEKLPSLFILYLLASFILGAIPFGKIIARFAMGTDITRHGSGNIGATNVARTIGIRWGLLTLLLDALKGFLPVYLSYQLFPGMTLGPSLGGLCALLGHQFSPFLRFRGGKGVAAALGMYLALAPGPCLLAMILFLAIVYATDFVSLGSMVAALAVPVLFLVWGKPFGIVLIAATTAVLICVMHRGNIALLLKGQERKWRGQNVQDNSSSRRSSSSSE